MLRKAFRMSVHRGQEAEYERRHRPVWRELEETLRHHGVHRYSIYLDDATGDLFAYVELESEDRWREIASTEVCRRWWGHMREIMPANPDASPVVRDLREVFHLEPPDRPRAAETPAFVSEHFGARG
jgi:L-rhamnose mutarotase